MAKHSMFIAGTDTDIGKTYITTGLLRAFQRDHYSALGIKPVASGCHNENNTLRNSDALALQAASSITLPYDKINPFAFAPAIAPHIAADQAEKKLSVNTLVDASRYALDYPADICLIEGAGGWDVPLNRHETLADFAKHLAVPVLLVVGIRLGCINHALLTYRAIKADNIPLLGWIANIIDPNLPYLPECIQSITERIPEPCFGIVEFNNPPENCIAINSIMSAMQR